jgi:hypothetical protein
LIIVNVTEKHLYINQSTFGLWEQCAGLWPGYKLTMGNYGYTGILQRAGMEITHLQMEHAEAVKLFEELVAPRDNLKPLAIAEIDLPPMSK